MSNLAINSLNTFLVQLPHGYVRGTTDSSAGKSLKMTDWTLKGMASNRNVYSRERALSDALNTFSDKTGTLYQSLNSFEFPTGNLARLFRTASVSDSDKISAQATSGATSTNYLVEIDRLATAQTNRSDTLVSTETTDLAEGAYAFTLTVDDTTYSLGISVDKSGLHPDTNKDVFDKLAREIGSADDSIEAFVTKTDRKIYSTLSDNMSEEVAYLTIRNKNTGDASHFSLSDGTGSIIDTLDINHIAQGGQESQYHLNSAQSTTAANSASADNGYLTIYFLDTAAEPVTITVKEGLEPVQEKLTDLISAYNGYISWLDQNSSHIESAVKTGIMEEIDSISRDLSSIGLQFKTTGKVKITDGFSTALQSDIGAVRETLTGEDGLFTKVAAKLAEILQNGVQEYGLYQSQSPIYDQQGLTRRNTFFVNIRESSELSLFA